MKMISLALCGNNRLLLAKIKYIKINFESDCQTIIGTNGSGKSTILRECSPLPANTADYEKGGYKKAYFEEKGEYYTAYSHYDKSWEHSLIRHSDNAELNPGKTKRVQEQLIESITGLTYTLFDVLVGDLTFTQMTPAKRREFILSFSGSDLEYAMKVYRDLNKRYMDSMALQKHYAKRLATELEGLMREEELNELNRISKELTVTINDLLMERGRDRLPISQDEVLRQHLKVEHWFKVVDESNFHLPVSLKDLIHSEDDIPLVKRDLQTNITNLERELRGVYDEQARVQECLTALNANGMQGLDDMIKQNDAHRKEMSCIESSILHYLDKNAPQQAAGALNSILMELVTIFNQLPADIADYRELINAKRADQHHCHDLLTKRQMELSELEHQLYHFNNIDTMQCPNCEHQWLPGVDEAHAHRVQTKYHQVKEIVEKLGEKLEELNRFMGEAEVFNRQMDQLGQMMNKIPLLEPMWHHIRTHIDANEPPAFLMPYVHEYASDLESSIKYQRIGQELHSNEIIVENAKALTQGHDDLNRDRLEYLDQQAERYINRIREYRVKLSTLNDYETKYNRFMDAVEKFLNESVDLENKVGDFLEVQRNMCLDEDIAELQTRVAEIQGKIAHANTAHALIEELRKNKVIADEEVQTYKLLVDGLSPTTGLIADRIRTFIDGFIGQINALIDEVWTYPMRIIGCGVEDAVDCKFPLESEGENSDGVIKVVSSDIAKSSSAQTDFINFGARLVAMMCKGLEEYPLYMDEVGVRMDEKHRDRFNALIERILENKRVSQIFLISHYAAVHGVFTNAQVAVIDQNNILTLPDEYNHHVEIEYVN